MSNFKTGSLLTAAVLAPFFARSEDRGYFRTALLTTPAIFAAGAFVPGMIPSTRTSARTLVDMGKAIRFRAKEATNIVDKRVADALVRSTRRARDLGQERRTLDKYLKRRFVKTQKLIDEAAGGNLLAQQQIAEIEAFQEANKTLLSNAFRSAKYSALTPEEWSKLAQDEMGLTGDLTNSQMLEMYQKYEGRDGFVRTLRQRLREIHPGNKNALKYKGPVSTTVLKSNSALNVETHTLNLAGYDPQFPDSVDVYTRTFREEHPQAFENLLSARRKGLIANPDIHVARAVTSGETGRILNVKVVRTGNIKGELNISLVDKKTGQVRLGQSFEQIGVGNYVLGPNDSGSLTHFSLIDWISKMLAEQSNLSTEKLSEDITAHNYWMAADPLDSRRMAELGMFDLGGRNVYNPLQVKIRSLSAGITRQPIFRNSRGQLVSFEELMPDEQMPLLKQMANNNRYIPMGSEAGVYEMRYQLREAAYLDPLGITGADKQDWLWRTLTKEFGLAAPEGLPPEAELGWTNKAWNALPGEIPLAKGTVHLLDPQDRTLFSELPETWAELQLQREEIIKKFMDRNMSRPSAIDMYNDIQKMYERGDSGILQQLGRMGESVTLMDEKFSHKFQVEGISKYNVNEGLSVNVGDFVDPDEVMGFMDKVRVTPKYSGQVVGISSDGTINVKHALSMHGAKLDFSVKGMNLETNMDKMRSLFNAFYERTGSSNFIAEDVNILGTSEYLGDKVDPVQAYLGLGSDLTKRLEGKEGTTGAVDEYLAGMSKLGARFENGQFILNPVDFGGLSNEGMVDRLTRLSAVSETFFAKAGEAIRSAGGYQDPVLTAFVHSGKDYGTWMMKNRLQLAFGAWDHSLVNTPRQVMIGHDFESFMTLGKNLKGLEAIRSRLQTTSGGDPTKSIEFMKYLMEGDFSKELGTVIPLNQAFRNDKSLSEAINRAGTIFDPSKPEYMNNFRVDLGEGKYLPVPGTAAYGAEAPLFEPGRYQTRSWQNILRDLAFAPPEKKAGLEADLIQAYKAEFGVGKGSAIRPYQFDPNATAGILGVTSEQGDPFTARVGDEFINNIRSEKVRNALLRGDTAVGILQRQPTNELMYLKYKYDKSFSGTMDVGISERTSRMFYGDVDKDLINNMFIDAHIRIEKGKMKILNASNALEEAAAQEAIEAIEGGRQASRLAMWEKMMGTSEVASTITDYTPKPLTGMVEKMIAGISGRADKIMSRTAGGLIGRNSKIYTTMIEHMVQASPGLDEDVVTRLRIGLFEGLKQTPISARKVGGFSIETMAHLANQMNNAVANNNSSEAAAQIRELMTSITERTKSPVQSYWKDASSAADLEQWAVRRTEKARLAAAALNVSKDIGSRRRAATKVLPDLFSKGFENVMGEAHGGWAAADSASKLGAISDVLSAAGKDASKSVTGAVSKVLAQHGSKMALGLGALAALGIALTRATPVASFSRASGNSLRPEERAGVADNIPGEPIPGLMAPSMPPRRVEAAMPNVRTTVVAPMNNASDLSVRMKATDRSRAAETARQLSQIPGSGYSNVTVNYRDRTKIGSLRTREKIREIR
jgi:hypothetical protein